MTKQKTNAVPLPPKKRQKSTPRLSSETSVLISSLLLMAPTHNVLMSKERKLAFQSS